MKTIRLNKKQYQAIYNKEPVYAFLGGVATGKSTAGSHFALNKVEDCSDQVGIIFANTNKQLNTATLMKFKETLAYYGWIKDVHYVTGQDPKRMFDYNSKFDKHNGIWSFCNGAQIITFSLESTIEGIEAGWGWGDEIQDAGEDQLKVVYARMRGAESPQLLFTLTPPKGNKYIDGLIWGDGKNSIPKVVSTTYDNERNLPKGFIPTLKLQYDTMTFDREVMAKRVAAVKNRWVYALDDDKIMNRIFTKGLEYIPTVPVNLSFDFNKEPFVCLASQRFDGHIRYIKEFRLANSSIETMCLQIRTLFHNNGFGGYVNYYITGDAAGRWSDNPLLDSYTTYYQQIAVYLRVGDGNFNVPECNPKHFVSRQQCNAICQHHPSILIDENGCPFLKDDLLYVESVGNGEINKKNSRLTHLLDAWRYDLFVYEQDYLAHVKENA